MSTIENVATTVIPNRSSIVHTRYLSPSTQHNRDMNGEYPSVAKSPSTDDVNVSFSKDEKQNLTPYGKLLYDSYYDPRFKAEVNAGRRIGFYRIYKDIGLGNFSRVKLGMHQLAKEKVAIKILDKTKLDSKTQRFLLREITSMEKLLHPNIIRLYEVIETPKEIYFVTEYASGGELYTRISDNGKLSEDEAKYIFAQIVSAVDYIHRKNIIHRDIKSENVFFAKERLIKLGDFGFSTYSEKNQTLTTFCGSPPYAAPELYRDDSYVGIYVDIWAMGVTLYFMVTALMPFRAETIPKLRKAIVDGHYSIPHFLSDPCQELIRGLLCYQISERWTIDNIRSCSWLNKQTFTKEFDTVSSNLTNYSPSILKTITNRSSLEYQSYIKLQELGISSELSQTTNSSYETIRDSVNGTYRIILHRLQKQSTALERDETYEKRMKEELPTSLDRSASFNNGNNPRKNKRPFNSEVTHTKVCNIL